MKIVSELNDPVVTRVLKRGGVIVARTDTLYGILAKADNAAAVAKVFRLKDRAEHKSPIVLIASKKQIYDPISAATDTVCASVWPGKVSMIILSLHSPKWLRRENDSIAYRLPDHDQLRQIIEQTGPLIAPSANVESHVPAQSVDEAIDYFGEAVDVYVDEGIVEDDTPSQLIRVDESGNVERLR